VTTSTFKAVFTLDTESHTYRPTAHNLSSDQAVEQFNSESKARTTDQGERHRNHDVRRCRACKKTADELTRQHVTASTDSEQSEAQSASSENEGD